MLLRIEEHAARIESLINLPDMPQLFDDAFPAGRHI